jgi:hypothetical protein
LLRTLIEHEREFEVKTYATCNGKLENILWGTAEFVFSPIVIRLIKSRKNKRGGACSTHGPER